jgi:DeoR family transcriptional regulator of aga operon
MTTFPTLSNLERQQQLARLLDRDGRLTVTSICEQFGISEATARRDLDALAEQGLIQRVHGGAIRTRRAAPEEPILRRAQESETEKESIGRAAAALVEDGETIYLGSGTTVFQVAQNLLERKITVITNSLPVINEMASRPNITLIALGGMLRESELSFIGHLTEKSLGELNADKVIIGARALDLEQGLTNDYLPETLTDRAILKIGRIVILVADHTKCGVVSTAFLAPLAAMHTIVTDRGTNAEFIAALRARGINIVVA